MSSKKNNKENNSSNHPLLELFYLLFSPLGILIFIFLLALL
jgi:hypothetical protein